MFFTFEHPSLHLHSHSLIGVLEQWGLGRRVLLSLGSAHFSAFKWKTQLTTYSDNMFRVSRCFLGCKLRLQLLPQLYTKHGHRCYPNSDDDDECDLASKKGNDEEDNIYFYKSRGQHILTNPRILDNIVRKSAIKPTDTVLEIGPGTGNLTLKLLEAAQKVVAVEIDERMVEVLDKRVTNRGLRDKLMVSLTTFLLHV